MNKKTGRISEDEWCLHIQKLLGVIEQKNDIIRKLHKALRNYEKGNSEMDMVKSGVERP